MNTNIRAYDLFGNIALVKFPKQFGLKQKKKFAEKLLKEQKGVKTVLEKKEKIKGRLRKFETRYIAGEKTKEVLYRENDCVFRFNIDETYFSPRLSNERKEIASKIKKNEVVLVMFAGVAPFSIAIAKNSQARKVYSNEINREANKYAQLNIELNKVKNRVILLPGDMKRIAIQLSRHHHPEFATSLKYGLPREIAHHPPQGKNKLLTEKILSNFNVIVMPRPQLKDSFLKEAFALSKKGTRIYYYDFCNADEIDSIVEKVKQEAEKSKKKIKILNVKRAGEIGVKRFRVRVDFLVL